MSLKIYNTLTKKKEEFVPINKDMVGMYSCGPTVYNHAHIGNLRSYLMADLLQRTIKYNGWKINWVMNFTDIDDKTIRGATENYTMIADNNDLKKYTQKYIDIFKSDLVKLNIEKPNFVRATDKIEEIKKIIKKIVDLGFGYDKDGSIYFDIKKYQEKYRDYGKLVGEGFMKGIKFGATISADEYEKENIGDFALWRGWKESDSNIFWDDGKIPKGRPGWHIECSAISASELGDQFDVHSGGVDLIFPHHSNEIAQSQAASDKVPFVKYWFHSEHLLVEGEKMAKSKENFFTLKDIENKNFNPLALRYLCLGAHYRSKLNFTWKSLEAAQSALDRLYEFMKSDGLKIKNQESELEAKSKYENLFLEAINNDLDIPRALSIVWKMIKLKEISHQDKKLLLLKFDAVLGLGLNQVKKEELIIPDEVQKLIKEREEERRNKNWQKADELRRIIKEKGFTIKDVEEGTDIRRNKSKHINLK